MAIRASGTRRAVVAVLQTQIGRIGQPLHAIDEMDLSTHPRSLAECDLFQPPERALYLREPVVDEFDEIRHDNPSFRSRHAPDGTRRWLIGRRRFLLHKAGSDVNGNLVSRPCIQSYQMKVANPRRCPTTGTDVGCGVYRDGIEKCPKSNCHQQSAASGSDTAVARKHPNFRTRMLVQTAAPATQVPSTSGPTNRPRRRTVQEIRPRIDRQLGKQV